MEGQWKFLGGGGSQKQSFQRKEKEANWNFQWGGRVQTKKIPMGGVGWGGGGMDILWNHALHENPATTSDSI